ncbi:uncharacterized protein BJX67DRAFT_2117 [Aspergillus lucknowensis]|uniref:Uncharacterized protein n=1 Tax=Aspergillus lucknowensis TaxID=176173 RepID=A0ABR4M6S4_9EURO
MRPDLPSSNPETAPWTRTPAKSFSTAGDEVIMTVRNSHVGDHYYRATKHLSQVKVTCPRYRPVLPQPSRTTTRSPPTKQPRLWFHRSPVPLVASSFFSSSLHHPLFSVNIPGQADHADSGQPTCADRTPHRNSLPNCLHPPRILLSALPR